MVNAQIAVITSTQAPNNLRAAIRRALFAGAESVWIYLAMLLLAGLGRFEQSLTVVGVFVLYYGGMLVGRRLARVKRDWRLVQSLALATGVALLPLVIRFDFYRDVGLFDASWIGLYATRLFTLTNGISPDQLATLTLLFAFARGLRFASRPLTLWFVGYQFRLTVVYIFFILIAARFVQGTDLSRGVFLFFALWILSIALARVEEAGRERALGWNWTITFVGATALVLALAFVLGLLFQNGGLALLGALLTPVLYLVFLVVGLLLIPVVYIASFLFGWLEPVIRSLIERFQQLRLPSLPSSDNLLPNVVGPLQSLPWVAPLARTVLLLGVMILVALWVVRQLNRRMFRYESENFILEDAPTVADEAAKKKSRAMDSTRAGEIHAENIRRLYAAFLQRAEQAGLKRREAETPLEFLSRASDEWLGTDDDLNTLTRAYVAVHYAEHRADQTEVEQARAAWLRVRPRIVKPEAKKETRRS